MLSIEQIRPSLTWRIRQSALYPGKQLDEMELDADNDGYHFGAFAGNELVAVVSLFKTDNIWQFRKLAVVEKVQKQGIGTQLLLYIISFVETEGGNWLWCNARLAAIGFYNKLGFSAVGDVFSQNGIEFIVMQKELLSK